MSPYSTFPHTADLGIEVWAATDSELFLNAACAIFELITDTELVELRENRIITVHGIDHDDLLFNFLREALYLFNGGHFLARKIVLTRFEKKSLQASIEGELYDPEKHKIKTELKAVTYHQLNIRESSEGFKTRVVFDV